jgi:Lon protease-like protein
MNPPFGSHSELEGFPGSAPLFPLPNVVFFPHILLPLHVFEQRYRQMVEDAISGEGLIAMALLKPGSENVYHTKHAPIYNMVCVGRIGAHEQLPDGRYNVALQGLSRAAVLDEEDSDLPYRTARLDLRGDHYPRKPVIDRRHRQRELISGFREMLPKLELDNVFHYALDADVPLGGLCDILTYSMQLEPECAQSILDEYNVDLRSDLVLDSLRKLARQRGHCNNLGEFPPPFSWN